MRNGGLQKGRESNGKKKKTTIKKKKSQILLCSAGQNDIL